MIGCVVMGWSVLYGCCYLCSYCTPVSLVAAAATAAAAAAAATAAAAAAAAVTAACALVYNMAATCTAAATCSDLLLHGSCPTGCALPQNSTRVAAIAVTKHTLLCCSKALYIAATTARVPYRGTVATVVAAASTLL